MKKIILTFSFIVVSCFSVSLLNAQTFEWAKSFGGVFNDMGAKAIASDSEGNVYIFGHFGDSIDFDPGPASTSLTSIGPTYSDLFLSKLDSSGNFIWVKHIGTTDSETASDLYIDENDMIYITGAISSPTDFDPGPGIQMLNATGYTSYTAKFDSDGELIWARKTAEGSANGYFVRTDGSGSVYTIGTFSGSCDFDPDTTTFTLFPMGSYNTFISKLDSSGNFIVAVSTRGIGLSSAIPVDVSLDQNDNIFITGTLEGLVDFDPTSDTVAIASSTSQSDVFFCKFSSGGNLFWAKNVGSPYVDQPKGISVDNNGNCYISGGFNDPIFDFDPDTGIVSLFNNGGDIFILKIDSLGSFVSVKHIGGPGNDLVYDQKMDGAGNLYITGPFSGTVDFDPGPGIYAVNPPTTYNTYFAKYNSNGQLNWVEYVDHPSMGSLFAYHLYVDGAGNILSTGGLLNTIDFDFTAGTYDLTSYSSGIDFFVYKIGQDQCSNIALNIDSAFNGTCSDLGSAYSSVVGAFPPYDLQWNTVPVTTGSFATFDSSGIYTITMVDSVGCIKTSSVLIDTPPLYPDFDLDGNLISTSLQSGFGAYLWIDYFNDGCLSVSGTAKFVLDPDINFNSSNPAPDMISGDTLMWNFTNINYDSLHFNPQVFVTVSPTLLPGDSVNFSLILNPMAGDYDTLNNIKSYRIPIVSAYDPNVKSVYPSGVCIPKFVRNTDSLIYTVHFQNTGNDSAVNVVIIDTLDLDLDLNSMRIIGNSHFLVTEIHPGNVVKFRFDHIYLPDSSTNEPLSHGYVVFEIKPVIGVSSGASISNNVGIYFDFNAPVYTNTVMNTITYLDPETIDCFAGVVDEQENRLHIYPNPTTGVIYLNGLENLDISSIMLLDVSGKLVKTVSADYDQHVVDLSELHRGVYFIRVICQDRIFSTKLIKI